jgi:hypothetical protein
VCVGAERGTRTPTSRLSPADFKSAASASSAIPAWDNSFYRQFDFLVSRLPGFPSLLAYPALTRGLHNFAPAALHSYEPIERRSNEV